MIEEDEFGFAINLKKPKLEQFCEEDLSTSSSLEEEAFSIDQNKLRFLLD